MYAIVKSGGKQYRVERGQQLLIERLTAKEGASVALEPILYRSEEAVFDKAGLERVKVTARVLAHVRGEKLRVFKFKPKRGYRRRTGHRQELTRIEVTEIAAGSAARARRPRATDAQGERAAAKPARTPAAKTAKPVSAKAAKPVSAKAAKPVPAPAADAEAKGKEAPSGKAKPADAAEADATQAAEAKATETAEAETTESPKPKRAKKSSAKAKKETGEDGT
jgi:large subunit ribosomal protein L21